MFSSFVGYQLSCFCMRMTRDCEEREQKHFVADKHIVSYINLFARLKHSPSLAGKTDQHFTLNFYNYTQRKKTTQLVTHQHSSHFTIAASFYRYANMYTDMCNCGRKPPDNGEIFMLKLQPGVHEKQIPTFRFTNIYTLQSGRFLGGSFRTCTIYGNLQSTL